MDKIEIIYKHLTCGNFYIYIHKICLSSMSYRIGNIKKINRLYSIIMVIYDKKTNVHMNYLYNQPHMANYCMQLDEIQSRYYLLKYSNNI